MNSTVSPVTNAFMKALPASLRPNPFNIDEEVMKAVQKGWTTDGLARACYEHERNPTPAFVVTNLRNLCQYGPKQEQQRKVWTYGHIACGETSHGPYCEICRCVPGVTEHHVPANPDNAASQRLRGLLA